MLYVFRSDSDDSWGRKTVQSSPVQNKRRIQESHAAAESAVPKTNRWVSPKESVPKTDLWVSPKTDRWVSPKTDRWVSPETYRWVSPKTDRWVSPKESQRNPQ